MVRKLILCLLVLSAGILLLYREVSARTEDRKPSATSQVVSGSLIHAFLQDLSAFMFPRPEISDEQDANVLVMTLPELSPEEPPKPEVQSRFAYSHFVLPLSSKYGVDWKLVASVMAVESNFNPMAKSEKGALGLMQLMPQTASIYRLTPEELLDPRKNIEAGVRHLRRLHRHFDGNLELIIAAYNCGEGAVEKFGGVPPFRHTQDFVRKVLHKYNAPLAFLKRKPVNL